MNGFIVIDKPKGITSHDVVWRLRKQLGTRKIGHAGSLDPLASGVLVCAVNKGLKLLEYIIEDTKKVYVATIQFGKKSNTYDMEGTLELVSEHMPSRVEIENMLVKEFSGDRRQVPPPFSRVRVKGRPAYEYARKGEAVSIPPRQVTLQKYKIISYDNGVLRLSLEVSKGYYIRSLAHDLGQALGCGAYLADLRRTQVGQFTDKQAHVLETVTSGTPLLPLTEICSIMTCIHVNEIERDALAHGKKLTRDITAGITVCAQYDDEIISILQAQDTGELKIVKNLI